MTGICTAPNYKIKELNHLFIELTAQNCNQRCKSCYINFPMSKNIKDYIPVEKVKEILSDAKGENILCIYLTGAEPMLHPDFNTILRYCIKFCNVCICTNGSFLNEKKVRFLKKVEDEVVNINNNQIFFKLSLTHFNEIENDKAKYRGNFRQTIFALKTLARYNFNSILNIQNYYNVDNKMLKYEFEKLLNSQSISNTDIKITPSFPTENSNLKEAQRTDCMYGRVAGVNGIYSCPFLSNDFRGRVGSSLKNYSNNFRAETDFCSICAKNNDFIFAIG